MANRDTGRPATSPAARAQATRCLRLLLGLQVALVLCGFSSMAAAGTVEEKYPNGKLRLRYSTDDNGRKDGFYAEYYPHGRFKLLANYKAGQLSGPYAEFYEDGKPKSRSSFVADRRHGAHTEFFPNGRTSRAALYRDGELHGKLTDYYDNGKTRIVAEFSNGWLHGSYMEFHPDGSVAVVAAYKNGELDGERIEKDATGRIVSAKIFVEGKETGSVKTDKFGRMVHNGAVYYHGRSADVIRKKLGELDPRRDVEGDSSEARVAALQRLKAYRYLAGVPFDSLILDDEYNRLTTAGATLCKALNRLDHTPTNPGWPDDEYRFAYRGTSQSNLFMGLGNLARTVDGYMDDSDPSNIDRIGHRRWCLNPAMGKTGFGLVGRFSAMYAFDDTGGKHHEYDYIAWPPPGFIPVEYFGPHHAWNVSLHPGKFRPPDPDKVKVEVFEVDAKLKKSAAPLKLNHLSFSNPRVLMGVPLCVIFRPAEQKVKPGQVYIVEITGLHTSGGDDTSITYMVEFMSLR